MSMFNGVDEKKKSDIFSSKELDAFIGSTELDDAYWLVRKAVVILAYYGGLRLVDLMNLELQNFSSSIEGVFVVQQRSDNRETRFLVPRGGETDCFTSKAIFRY